MEDKKIYCLYSNKEQSKLHAIAYSEEQIAEETQYYKSGVWFEYDLINNHLLDNEKQYKKKVQFPEEPKERPKYTEKKDTYMWVK